MTAKDIMVTNVITVTPETGILEIEELFKKHQISMVPVVNQDNIVQGIVTEQEFFDPDHKIHLPTYIRLLKETSFVGHENKKLPYTAEQLVHADAFWVMNKNVYFASPDMQIEDLPMILAGKGADNVVVVDSGNHLLGTISRRDYITSFAHQGSIKTPKSLVPIRRIDTELEHTYKDLKSHFAFVSKARADVWLTTGIILFIIGFVIGFIYIWKIF